MVLLMIGSSDDILDENGESVSVEEAAIYLGSLLIIDRRPRTELSRRLAEAGKTFDSLVAVWNHSNLSISYGIRVFSACVIRKLVYSLESM